jgi:ketosteroid isomerase-like protein
MPHPAAELVRRYFDAFQRGDSTAYAACWAYPAATFAAGFWRSVATPAEMARGNDDYTRVLLERGVRGGEIVSLEVQELGKSAAMVHGRFTRTDQSGAVVERVAAAYLAVSVDGDWQVAVCVVEAS